MQPEHSAQTAARRQHRPRLRGSHGMGIGQLFFVIFGFLITSALIFLFGIWVGRDYTERRLAQEERIVRVPVPAQPTTKPDAKPADVDLAFYEQLKEKAVQRLQQTAGAASPTAGREAQRVTPTPEPQRVAQKTPRVPTPAPQPKRSTASEHADEWADAGWTVQVNATTNPQQATDLAQTLKSKGYDAYTLQAPVRGQIWYRVRVGRFSSHDKAKQLEARLRSTEGLENAYVTPQ